MDLKNGVLRRTVQSLTKNEVQRVPPAVGEFTKTRSPGGAPMPGRHGGYLCVNRGEHGGRPGRTWKMQGTPLIRHDWQKLPRCGG
ncbi:hypothetical protein H6P81_002296 [Aristolochia fimbriata]|uniref:Uncharacterized protein n=1 Tax=Aristolochia fimbriata TaxID=158543 RepID=A0AAV7FDY5_ARIFI|nr:hypothetical protein H6P81_002296 [Aristolochia fimbriata]